MVTTSVVMSLCPAGISLSRVAFLLAGVKNVGFVLLCFTLITCRLEKRKVGVTDGVGDSERQNEKAEGRI